MNVKALSIAGTFLLGIQTSYAATPTISGTYLINISDVCQMVINPYPAGTTFFDPGDYESSTGTAKFNSKTSQVTINGTRIGGALLVPNSATGALHQDPFSAKNVAYTNTDTTLTLGTLVFQITYGTVKKGIAQQFTGAGIGQANQGEHSSNCVQRVTASRV